MPHSTQTEIITPTNSFPSFKKIAIVFVILAILVLIGIVYFSFAKATILLTVDNEPRTQSFDISLSTLDSEQTADLTGELITSELEISQDFNVSNYKEEPGVATGQIKIVNESSRNQTLIRTTRFLSSERVLFRLENTVNIPAGSILMADVYADEKGAAYNIEPTRFTIPGLSESLQKVIYGVSEKAMTGGIKKVGILIKEDVDSAGIEFENNLTTLVKEKITPEYEDKEILDSLIDVKILEQSVSGELGEEVENFTVAAKVLVTLVIADEDELIEKSKEAYRQKLVKGMSVVSWDLENMEYIIKTIDLANKFAVINVKLTANVQGAFDVNKFDKSEIAGFDRKGVEYYFSQYPSIKEIEINFSPFWVKSVPALADRIEIEVK